MTRCTRETLLRMLIARRHCTKTRVAVRALIAFHIRAMRP